MSAKKIIMKSLLQKAEKSDLVKLGSHLYKKELKRSFRNGFTLGTVVGSALTALAAVTICRQNNVKR